jgi:hypothetical protein
VADIAAFSLIVLSQRYVNRHRISESRHVKIGEEEGAKLATGDPATVLPVPQAREGVSQ